MFVSLALQIRQASIPLRFVFHDTESGNLHSVFPIVRDPQGLVQLRHLYADVVRVHVRIRECPRFFLP